MEGQYIKMEVSENRATPKSSIDGIFGDLASMLAYSHSRKAHQNCDVKHQNSEDADKPGLGAAYFQANPWVKALVKGENCR